MDGWMSIASNAPSHARVEIEIHQREAGRAASVDFISLRSVRGRWLKGTVRSFIHSIVRSFIQSCPD